MSISLLFLAILLVALLGSAIGYMLGYQHAATLHLRNLGKLLDKTASPSHTRENRLCRSARLIGE